MTDEAPRLDEVVNKPLDQDIFDDMAEDDVDSKDYVLYLFKVNPVQAGLIVRVLKTLKVDSMWMDEDDLNKLEKENQNE